MDELPEPAATPEQCGANEAWLAEPAKALPMPPPRYKVALLTWIGIFPVITLLLTVLGPTLASRSVVVRAFVLTACAIPIMTWIVMPIVTRFTGAWLYDGTRSKPARSDQLSSGPTR